MKFIIQFTKLQNLYNFFLFLALLNIFFSTGNSQAKTFSINDVEISTPFEINFNKNEIIDRGFTEAFNELILSIVQSKDQTKLKNTSIKKIKGMIETFSIKEEKFVDEIYYVKLGVTFNKKKIFNYLTQKNIFPSMPNKIKFLFIPIIIDEKKRDLKIFDNNQIYNEWNNDLKSFHLIEYVLPAEDLEDLNLIKKNYEIIEKYDFKEITKKYFLKNSIITLIFINDNEVRILSRITNKNDIKLNNKTFSGVDLKNLNQRKEIINELKNFYEDSWKKINQINTSIKLPLTIKISTKDNFKISKFERTLSKIDLINNFFIYKFDNDFIYYQIVFNGTPSVFLNLMSDKKFMINTDNKLWVLK